MPLSKIVRLYIPAKKKATRNTIECKVIHKDNTIVLTKRFATAASKPGTKEFKELAKTRQMFPTYEVIARTASPSAKRVSMKGLSYDFSVKIVNDTLSTLKLTKGALLCLKYTDMRAVLRQKKRVRTSIVRSEN